MLTALELVGFKSFADKTRFEFPPGITVVVGPNGSGKSNIVDAIKWVLGEQSAKSLRGKEMADVIYKGSASGNRKPFQSAEATLIFDNSGGLLPLDDEEVRITRRVYRSGEGEYMANGRPCRLRDVKDLFSGTGVGADAYSLIEQGKVDSLLQASHRERRSIFEEAAGISRFKAKKVETRRRLERVEQNLVRLADIVDEVEGRLRALRSQATKAQRYKQYSDRLRELRTYVGLKDWRRLTETIDSLGQEIEDLNVLIEEENGANTSLETTKMALDAEMEQKRECVLACESTVSRLRELVASRESDIINRRRQCEDLDIEVLELRRRLLTVTSRAGDIRSQEKQEKKLLAAAELERDEIARRLEKSEAGHAVQSQQLEQARNANQQRREEHMQRMQESASLNDRIGSFRSQLETADATVSQHRQRLEEIDQKHTSLCDRIDTLCLEKESFENRVNIEREKLEGAQDRLAGHRKSQSQHQQQLAELQSRLVGARERALVLEELERRLEGLSAGVKEVLGRARDQQSGPFSDVRGLVADLVRVNIESATLIEAALGKIAQYVVFSGDRFQEFLCRDSHTLKGRAGFVRLDRADDRDEGNLPDLEHKSGVLGRADRFVTTSPEYRPLVERLLARTWFVKSLSQAMVLHAENPAARFVTPAGELVEADGSLLVGPGSNATGLISRRSELRALRMQIDDLNRKIEIERTAVSHCNEEIRQGESEVQRCSEAARAAESSLYEHAGKLSGAEDRRRRLEEDREKIEPELESAREKSRNFSSDIEQSSARLEKIKQGIAETEVVLASEAEEIATTERELARQAEIVTAGKIELARGEQRIESHRAALRQFAEARKERSRVIADIRGQIERNTQRISQAHREILAASSETATAYLEQESAIAQRKIHEAEIAQLQQQRATLSGKFREIAARLKKLEKQRHTHEMNVSQARMERDTLADRLRDDYGIELAELLHSQPQIELFPKSDPDAEDEIDQVEDPEDIEQEEEYDEDEFEEDDELDEEYDEEYDEEEELDDEHEEEDELDEEEEPEDELEEDEPEDEDQVVDPEQQQAEIEREIEDLRHKLATIGSVNMEALAELEELETRYNALSSQYQDLTDARDTLERIIARINNDSRRLFAETLEAISENFRNLFRHVFGGGSADIILEEGVDILEAGIEIVAMPPGKHALNISLLSGGEKAMTAVTLLLAIFQFRPSPFCVLDEVDGPLDEANIGRFINTLQTFLDTTRFVIVTHSKKTMVAATTLYGITMQESGISKRVSVRFDDVGENGEISQTAIDNDDQQSKAA